MSAKLIEAMLREEIRRLVSEGSNVAAITLVMTVRNDMAPVVITAVDKPGDAVEWYAHTTYVLDVGTGLLHDPPEPKEGGAVHPGATDSGSEPGA